MIRIDDLRIYYPPLVRDNALFNKYILKEYIQLLILDYLSTHSLDKKNYPYRRNMPAAGKRYRQVLRGSGLRLQGFIMGGILKDD